MAEVSINKKPSIRRRRLPGVLGSCVLIFILFSCIAVLAFTVVFGPSVYRSLAASYFAMRADGKYYNSAFTEAISDYTWAIQLKPGFYEALVYRGSSYGHLEDYERAKSDFETAIDLDPKRGDAYNALCWYGSLLGKAEDVLRDCEQAVILEPDSPHFRDSRGLARALTGDTPGAILDFQYFVEQAKTNTDIGAGDTMERMKWISALKKGLDPFTECRIII